MTRLPLVLALGLALGASGSALAAQTQASTMQTPAKAGPVVDPDAMKALNQNNLSQQLKDQLSKAGYTSIKVMPSSFYVQAKDKNGDAVAMVIGPDSFTEVTEMKPQASAATPPAQGSSQSSSQSSSNTTQK